MISKITITEKELEQLIDMYESYDCLFNVNKYIFAGYNWKRRILHFIN